jgi:glycosyltransferase involved in cell wall biosynthesis
MRNELKIGIVQRSDVADVRSLSGYPYFMAKALEKHVGEVVCLYPDDSFLTRAIEATGKALNRLSYLTVRRHISTDHHRILSKRLARTFIPWVARSGCNAIFAPNASVEIANLSTDIPIVYSTDMNWANIVDYYPSCSALFEFARLEGDRIETAAIGKASALIYPSTWAAKTAIDHYKADPRKVHCIPFGANFEEADIPPREAALRHSLDGGITLLWVGVDWQRKGGVIAYDCLLGLLSKGVNARLVVCGCVPPGRYRHPKLEVIPFLSKRDPVQRRRLSQLYLEANFLLFPTAAEAYGIVLCEASAHGLPSLVRDTGGVGGAIKNGENGYLLPSDANGQQYAEKILTIVQDRSVYDGLVHSSRKAYEEKLNWDAWGRAVKPIFEYVRDQNRLSRVRKVTSSKSAVHITKMKIGIVHRLDVADVRSLSGSQYFMVKALEKHVGEVVRLCPDEDLLTKATEYLAKALNRVSYLVVRRHISTDHHRILSKRLARTLGLRLAGSGCDVLFAPLASVEIAYLITNIPIVYFTDMNWADIVDYYPNCSALFEFARLEGDRIETAAIGKASALIYPSTWAAGTAIDHYKADPEKVHYIPSGANFEEADIPPREAALRHSLDGGITLLWVGVDWQRKGGVIAYDCLLGLLSKGVNARLVVCGCVPPGRYRHPKLEVIPFLSKRDPVQRRRLSQLYLEANFLLFPTAAEAYGIVLCEASAHGLPSLVRDTGGVGGAIKNGENGYLLPSDANGQQYAEKILTIVQDRSVYDGLVHSSRKAYEEKLNWDAWGRAVKPIFKAAVEGRAVEATSV